MTGQEHVVRTIENALKLDRVAHAYLFCGPRGVGKTTAARLLARALNCEKGPTPTPCGVCKQCVEIRDGNSTDVAEIDGASNNGVENVREIRENAKYLPQTGRYKIYIIDEVHMLSGPAFNALLKTLEEPPPHVKFIFATTEAHKLPDTIISRCQRHNFRRISAAAMLKRLSEICGLEKVKVSDASLSLIVRQSEGGMRDALSLLDQVISACGLEPRDADVAEALGAIDRTMVHAFAEALVRRDNQVLLQKAEQVWNLGLDLNRVAEELAWYLRHVFVAKATGNAPEELADSEREAVLALSREADAATLAPPVRRGARRHLGHRPLAPAPPRARGHPAQGRAAGSRRGHLRADRPRRTPAGRHRRYDRQDPDCWSAGWSLRSVELSRLSPRRLASSKSPSRNPTSSSSPLKARPKVAPRVNACPAKSPKRPPSPRSLPFILSVASTQSTRSRRVRAPSHRSPRSPPFILSVASTQSTRSRRMCAPSYRSPCSPPFILSVASTQSTRSRRMCAPSPRSPRPLCRRPP